MNGEGVTGAIGNDTGPAPSANEEVQPFGSITAKFAAVTKRQVIDVVSADQVASIEVRTCAAYPEVLQITDDAGTGPGVGHIVVGDVRHVVDGVRVGVVKVKLQAVRDALAECEQQPVVIGAGVVSDVAVCASLSRQGNVGRHQSIL